jgi:O-antigen/teichoic acid export membrane protein
MSLRSRIIAIVFVVLALLCVPFLFGTTEATVGSGVSWIVLLLCIAIGFFLRAHVQARRERADAALVEDLLPNEADRQGEL